VARLTGNWRIWRSIYVLYGRVKTLRSENTWDLKRRNKDLLEEIAV
jgi:hypothetical protein